jgi:uncharacterized membrane protein
MQGRTSLDKEKYLANESYDGDGTSRGTVYFPHDWFLFAVLLALLLLVIGLLFVGVVGLAFRKVGFSPVATALILIGTFLGSNINIPLFKLKSRAPIVKEEYVNFFGITYRIPQVQYGTSTLVAVNVGGALIPTGVSIYLLCRASAQIIIYSLIGVAIVALVTHLIARPVKGVGIETPALVPPIAAAIVAFILFPGSPVIIAYVSGTLGTLIGADLSNLKAIPQLGAPVASIGGAGTFDGVFLSGIMAALLAAI